MVVQSIKVLRGVIPLDFSGAITIYGPGDIVSDTDQLSALGPDRLSGLVADGIVSLDLSAAPVDTPLTDVDRASARAAYASAHGR